jgi:transcriptional regulator GlxA family with amidase domain
MARRNAFLVYPRFQLLDTAGPLAAFEVAERIRPGSYQLQVLSAAPGAVASSAGVTLAARGLGSAARIDTLVVAGGEGAYTALGCARTRAFLRRCAQRARRVTSVCSGSFLLAGAGLLEGRSATTHWSVSERFRRSFPGVRLESDRIFVRAGKYWSSAGITAGIDLALALIGEDLGDAVARRTAQYLVVYHRRPGGQSQFSPLLELGDAAAPFAALLEAVRARLDRRWSVAELAAHACMSPRNFARSFLARTGLTPAKAVERVRADAARALLESGGRGIQQVALACGFGEPERMRRAFLRQFGAPPSRLRA